LRGLATACIDLSDGLSLDLHRLCVASRVAAEVDLVPVIRGSTMERALHGGEDYEVLFTTREGAKLPRRERESAEVVRGEPGTVQFQGRPLALRSYDHFHE
jgi:thiamine-monophosphate kinase